MNLLLLPRSCWTQAGRATAGARAAWTAARSCTATAAPSCTPAPDVALEYYMQARAHAPAHATGPPLALVPANLESHALPRGLGSVPCLRVLL